MAPGAVWVGQHQVCAARVGDDERIEIELPSDLLRAVAIEGQHRQPARDGPARELRRMGDCLGIVGLGVEQQRGQPAAPALTLAGLVRLDPDIALDHVGGELVRVDEDRLGERDHGRGVDPGPGGELGGPAPGGTRAGPERRPERFEAAAGLELGLPEPPPHLVGFGPRTLAALDRVEESLDRLLDPHPDAQAFRTAEHVGVDGVLAPDRPDHVVDKRTHASADSCGGLRRQPLWRPRHLSHVDKSCPDIRCPGPWSGGCNRRTVHILTRRSITETHARIAQLGWEPSYHDPRSAIRPGTGSRTRPRTR